MLQLSTSQGLAVPGLRYVGLRAAFDDALPTPCWAPAATTRILVGLASLADWRPWLPDACEMLDAAELERIRRRRFAADRDELALAYALHRLLLGKVLDCDAAEVPIGRDSLGCPRLRGELLFTSLSHANGCVALAVTATGPVGVDIESAARASDMPEIAGRVCHPVDAAELAAFVGPAWSAALLALWVRKEAFLKAAGIGLEREMQAFPAPDNALLPLPRPGGKPTRLRMLDVGAHWIAAVAGSPDTSIESAWLRPVLAAGATGIH
ncbi:MAG: 4'-phosphopantetheinyl transferase family protein [Luteimonas sp.]